MSEKMPAPQANVEASAEVKAEKLSEMFKDMPKDTKVTELLKEVKPMTREEILASYAGKPENMSEEDWGAAVDLMEEAEQQDADEENAIRIKRLEAAKSVGFNPDAEEGDYDYPGEMTIEDVMKALDDKEKYGEKHERRTEHVERSRADLDIAQSRLDRLNNLHDGKETEIDPDDEAFINEHGYSKEKQIIIDIDVERAVAAAEKDNGFVLDTEKDKIRREIEDNAKREFEKEEKAFAEVAEKMAKGGEEAEQAYEAEKARLEDAVQKRDEHLRMADGRPNEEFDPEGKNFNSYYLADAVDYMKMRQAAEFLAENPEIKQEMAQVAAKAEELQNAADAGEGEPADGENGGENPEGAGEASGEESGEDNPADNPEGEPADNPEGAEGGAAAGGEAQPEPEPTPEPQQSGPDIIATRANLEKDAKDAARDISEKILQEKLTSGRFKWLKRIVAGQLFREGFLAHYEKQAYNMIVAKQKGESLGEKSRGLSDQEWSVSNAGIERFVQAYIKGYEKEMIHSAAGEGMDVYGLNENGEAVKYVKGEDGKEKAEEIDQDSPEAIATKGIHEAISKYAKGEIDKANFEEQMNRLAAEAMDRGSKADLSINNYIEAAETARERMEIEHDINNVMNGFRFINAEARRNVRTEAHRDLLDKCVDKLENLPGLRLLPTEVVAGAAGFAVAFSQRATGGVLRAVAPGIGGAVSAGFFAGLKERNRVATDRRIQARRLATGEGAGDTKYDKAMEKTMYESKPANAYTNELYAALDKYKASPNNPALKKELITILAQVNVAEDLSDGVGKSPSERMDLISFSSGDSAVIEDERMALDVARAEARAALGPSAMESESYTEAVEYARETFEADINSKNAAFRKLRAKRVAAQSVKTAAVAAIFAVAGQEVVAAFDPNQYGIADEIFHLQNNAGAHNTMLAGIAGFKGVEHIRGEALTGLTKEQAEAYASRNSSAVVSSREIVHTNTTTENISASEFAAERGVPVHRTAWGVNQYANVADGNELRVYSTADNNGFFSGMTGNSVTGTGQVINYEQAVSEGKITAFMSLSRDTQATPIEIPAILGPDGKLQFIPDDPALQQAITNNDFGFFEVAYNAGVENGVDQIIPLATVVGDGSMDSLIPVTTSTQVIETVYDVLKPEQTIEHARDILAAAGIPLTSRKDLSFKEGTQPRVARNARPVVTNTTAQASSAPAGSATQSTTSSSPSSSPSSNSGSSSSGAGGGYYGSGGGNGGGGGYYRAPQSSEKAPEPSSSAPESKAESAPAAFIDAPIMAGAENLNLGGRVDMNAIIAASMNGDLTSTVAEINGYASSQGREITASQFAANHAAYYRDFSIALRDWDNMPIEQRKAIVATGNVPADAPSSVKNFLPKMIKLGLIKIGGEVPQEDLADKAEPKPEEQPVDQSGEQNPADGQPAEGQPAEGSGEATPAPAPAPAQPAAPAPAAPAGPAPTAAAA